MKKGSGRFVIWIVAIGLVLLLAAACAPRAEAPPPAGGEEKKPVEKPEQAKPKTGGDLVVALFS